MRILKKYFQICPFDMDELINIANYCNNILVKYGENIIHCNAIYIKEDNIIEFRIKYKFSKRESIHTFQYAIENFNFTMTDTEVLVNKSTITVLNNLIEEKISKQYADI